MSHQKEDNKMKNEFAMQLPTGERITVNEEMAHVMFARGDLVTLVEGEDPLGLSQPIGELYRPTLAAAKARKTGNEEAMPQPNPNMIGKPAPLFHYVELPKL
jgi:hypothetical protein